VLQALFEAGVEGPDAIVGTSVGALNGSAIAAYPSLAGVMMLREVWMSRPALSVFQAHPIGMLVSGIRRDLLSAFPQEGAGAHRHHHLRAAACAARRRRHRPERRQAGGLSLG
jgi:hypothetical protein